MGGGVWKERGGGYDQKTRHGILGGLMKTRKAKEIERVLAAAVLRSPASGSCGVIGGT